MLMRAPGEQTSVDSCLPTYENDVQGTNANLAVTSSSSQYIHPEPCHADYTSEIAFRTPASTAIQYAATLDIEQGLASIHQNEFEPTLDDMLRLQRGLNHYMTRRRFFGSVGRAALYTVLAETVDRVISENFIWNRKESRVDVLDSNTPDSAKHHAFLLYPGLGVEQSSSYAMVDNLRPYLQRYGKLISMSYAQLGFTREAFDEQAVTVSRTLHEHEITDVTLLGHSAGLANAVRMLNAPVTQLRGVFGLRTSILTGSAHQYWQNEGINIVNVAAISAPPTSREIKGGAQRFTADIIDTIPQPFLRFGFVAKFIGNLINNHTIDSENYTDAEFGARWESAFRSAQTEYSATAWAQQIDVLNYAKKISFPGTFSEDVHFGEFVPRDPANDTVVRTDLITEGWSRSLAIPREKIITYTSTKIGHANINSHPAEYAAMFIRAFFPDTNRARIGGI